MNYAPRFFLSIGVLTALLPVAGCVEREVVYREPPRLYRPPQPEAPQIVTYVAPPPPRIEYQPPPPTQDPFWVWAPGHWHWDGAAYAWRPGNWRRRPNPHVIWHPAHWEARGNSWVFVEGQFRG